MFKVAKPFVTVSRRFKAGDPIVPDDCDNRGQWWGFRQTGFIVEDPKTDASAVASVVATDVETVVTPHPHEAA